MWIRVCDTLHTHNPQMTNQAKPQYYLARPNHIFSVFHDGCQIYAHLLNKWKHKKESCGGWLFWGAFIALPLRSACVVWFVERLKWGWLVEQRLALDLHTLLNHTDSWLPVLPTNSPQTQIYLHAGALPDSEPYGSYNTQPSAESQPQPAVDNVGCWETTASKWFSAKDCSRGYRAKAQKGMENWWQREERGSEGHCLCCDG